MLLRTFQWVLYFLNWAGHVTTAIVLVVVVRRFVLWTQGISPALRGLGNGLRKRKIALYARNENLAGIREALLRSKLFREENIFGIQRPEDIGSAEDTSVFVMYWPDWADHLDAILNIKDDATPLIVYCPRKADRISDGDMEKIDRHRNTAISNFRGRLLNDIVTAMITTSYE
jgi:hypothetical protein